MGRRFYVREGSLRVLLSLLESGVHTGSYKITYKDHNGVPKVGGILKSEAKARERAMEIIEGLKNQASGRLTDMERDMLQIIRENKLTVYDINHLAKERRKKDALTVAAAVELFKRMVMGSRRYSDSNMSTYLLVFKELKAGLGAEMVWAIDSHALVERVTSKWQVGHKRFNNKRGVLNVFFQWLEDCEYIRKNPVSGVMRLEDDARDEAHEVLSPREFALLLYHCPDEYLPWLALAGFCGLRGVEIYGSRSTRTPRAGLDWEDIMWEDGVIVVQRGKTKIKRGGKQRTRLVEIPDVLGDWLEPWRGATGAVHPFPPPYNKKEGQSEPMTDTLGKLTGGWKGNALRASSVSYSLAISGNVDAVALAHGHSKQISMGEYLNPRMKRDAELWYQLTRDKVRELVEG